MLPTHLVSVLERYTADKSENKIVEAFVILEKEHGPKALHWHQIREVNLYLPDPNKSAKLFSKHKTLTGKRLRMMPHGLHLGFRRHW